ncbi:MAG: tRNA epoxyqueuosine(34) reductase QueG [Kangiellaceae bacterium]|nr:tRNA epoxyqueuosine(34) reductase QueG [Kangiellaceae bacterium]
MHSLDAIKKAICDLANEQGFQQARVSDVHTGKYFEEFERWVNDGMHGSMSYLERNMDLRQFPEKLQPETCRVISFRYDYLPEKASFGKILSAPELANISRYALGRDYHKLIRKKLQLIARSVEELVDDLSFRVFVDSAPVLETSFAEKSGIGWKGKHTLTINQEAGSWFFLGEIFINLPLSTDSPVENKCGQCNACINLCPTAAIVAPYKIDARRCISYLTIENKDSIPLEFREAMGNRIYGCDDCQLACPWNRFASISQESDFQPRYNLDSESLLNLFNWTEEEFNQRLLGSPIRRIGFDCWQRNIAIALGNAPNNDLIAKTLQDKLENSSPMVAEHIQWALGQQQKSHTANTTTISNKTQKLIRTINKMLPRDA